MGEETTSALRNPAEGSDGPAGQPGRLPGATGTPLFNVDPCLRDPVTRLLVHRWRLSPPAGALLFLALYLGGYTLFALLGGVAFPRPGLERPLLTDRQALVLYSFVIPVGIFQAIRFYRQAQDTFERLFSEGVVQAPVDAYNQFLKRLHRSYNSRPVHYGALVLATALYGWLTSRDAADPMLAWQDLSVGPTAAYHTTMSLIAWYSAMLVLLKAIVTGAAVRRIFDWPVRIQPFHPDGCGGLRLCTDISVSLALFNAIVALAVVILLWGGVPLLSGAVLGLVVLLALTPAIFAACLFRAHQVMAAHKASLLRDINRQLEGPYQDLQEGLARGVASEERAAEVLRLDSLHQFACRLPVWPTNTQVVAQVAVSVAVPLGLLALQFLLERVVRAG